MKKLLREAKGRYSQRQSICQLLIKLSYPHLLRNVLGGSVLLQKPLKKRQHCYVHWGYKWMRISWLYELNCDLKNISSKKQNCMEIRHKNGILRIFWETIN